jgi:4-amino-4-deoxy-L-arabinose transferase-like glycosyltransferase
VADVSHPARARFRLPDWTAVLLCLLAALSLKLIYLTLYARQMPFYTVPTGDSAIYLGWAQSIVSGDVWSQTESYRVFYHAPLYPYLLALSLAVFGSTLLPIYLAQLLLGTLSLLLTYRLARHLFSHRAGLLAIAIGALYAPLTFKESKLVAITLVVFLGMLALNLLVTSAGSERHPGRRWLLAGGVLGLATLAWGGVLIAVPVVLMWWLFLRPRPPLRLPTLLLAGWLVPVLAATSHNLLAGHDLVLVSANSGYTFYQGNNPAADGTISHPPEVFERTWQGRYPTGIADQQAFDLNYASLTRQRPLRPSEASAFWSGRGLDFIRRRPLSYLRLELAKLQLSLSNYEFASNYFLTVEQDRVPFLRFLAVPFALILALAGAGILLGRGDPARPRWPLFALATAVGLTLLAFYVGSRYRLPLVLPLTVFAGGAFDSIVKEIQRRRLPVSALALAGALLVISVVFCTLPLAGRHRFVTALGYRNLGEAEHVYRRNPALAEQAYDRALALLNSDQRTASPLTASTLSDILVLRGNARLDQNRFDPAEGDFRTARRLAPPAVEPLARLTVSAYARAEQPPGNRNWLDTALTRSREWCRADTANLVALALQGDILLAGGDTSAAEECYRRVGARDSKYVTVFLALGDIARLRGDDGEAQRNYRHVLGQDSTNMIAAQRLAILLGSAGEDSTARDILRSVLERVDRDPARRNAALGTAAGQYYELKYYLGFASLRLRDRVEAARLAREVLKVIPDHQNARRLLRLAIE